MKKYIGTIKNDLPASIVVFFVAIPLCLGIALASGAPLFSGLIAGIIGGIVVGLISGSQIGVSGPAAGLAAIVLVSIGSLGGFENFLLAVVLGGVIQCLFGIIGAGVIGQYFPSSVIKGMLTGIGLIIIFKQIPYFFGYSKTEEIDSYTISNFLSQIDLGSSIVGITSLFILIFWETILSKKSKIFQLIQGPLVAVIIGIIYTFSTSGNAQLEITSKHLVNVPQISNLFSLARFFTFPNFSVISNVDVWVVAFTIALVASLETLLCVEATDKLDVEKRVTPKNRELIAQGIGNIFSGIIGGLPVTQVIVRSSANIQSGGKTKVSAILHGFLLLISIISIPALLNMIPLSVLAAILLIVGYKLAKPKLFKSMYGLGWKQFLPFFITISGIIFTDLLIGIMMGLTVGIGIVLKESYHNSHSVIIDEKNEGNEHKIIINLSEEVTFINKEPISKELNSLPLNTDLTIDISKTRFLDNDIIDVLNDFLETTKEKKINVKVILENEVLDNPKNMNPMYQYKRKSA
jgi:MFS superfamily sulfate permease-like transporter